MQDNSWKLNLKAWEFVLLLVCIVLALFLAYFFGFRAGQAVGYDDALTKAIKNTPRLSAFEDAPSELNEEDLNSLYSKVTSAPQETEPNVDSDIAQPPTTTEAEPDLAALESDHQLAQASPSPSEVIDLQALAAREVIIDSRLPETIPQQPIQKIEEGAIMPPATDQEIVKVVDASSAIVPETQPAPPPATTAVEVAAKPSPSATPKPTPSPSPIQKVAPKTVFAPGWYVQVATSKSRETAEKLSKDLYASGFKSKIETIIIANQEFHRVLVGPEGQQAYANRLVEQLGREKFLSGKPFIRQVN